MNSFVIRPLTATDNKAIAAVIRNSLTEFGANKPGTVYFDPTTDNLSLLFAKAGSAYFIAESLVESLPLIDNDVFSATAVVAGGAGVYPTPGLPDGYCELVKLYLSPAFRGKGIGKKLIQTCFDAARLMGYEQMYLETMPELHNAIGLYEQEGFAFLNGPLGASGHFGCDLWMLKKL